MEFLVFLLDCKHLLEALQSCFLWWFTGQKGLVCFVFLIDYFICGAFECWQDACDQKQASFPQKIHFLSVLNNQVKRVQQSQLFAGLLVLESVRVIGVGKLSV